MVLFKYIFYILLGVILVNLLSNLINIEQYSILSPIISTVFLIIWFLCGARLYKRSTVLLFIILYPAVGILLGFIFQLSDWNLLAEFLQYLYVKPMRGFYFIQDFFQLKYQVIVEYIIIFVLPSISGLLGYLIHNRKLKLGNIQ